MSTGKGSRRASVQRYKRRVIGDIVSKERAVLACGCSVFIGVNPASNKAAARALPCCEGHRAVTDRAATLLVESTAHPVRKPAVEMAAHFLAQAARELSL